MPTTQAILEDLKAKGSEKTQATYARHGMPVERTLGVSVADLKSIAKSIKGQQTLACSLYETGMMEAMYLAGLVADGAKMTETQLRSWVEAAEGLPMILEYIVPWVTIENPLARDLAMDWIKSPKEHIASSGWRTYTGLVTVMPDEALNLKEIEDLLGTIARDIASERNRVKSTMNTFLISVGTYVQPLSAKAKAAAEQIGVVSVDVGDTACKIPVATEAIAKVESAGKAGQKRKTIRC